VSQVAQLDCYVRVEARRLSSSASSFSPSSKMAFIVMDRAGTYSNNLSLPNIEHAIPCQNVGLVSD
jgi:hypothetical protein